MNLIDLHCDTLWKLMDLGGEGDLLENDGSVSIRKLEEEGALAQFFACFVYRDAMEGNTPEEQYETSTIMLSSFILSTTRMPNGVSPFSILEGTWLLGAPIQFS